MRVITIAIGPSSSLEVPIGSYGVDGFSSPAYLDLVPSNKRRREMARLYAEMYDEGYDPSRGLAPVFIVMLAASIASIVILTIIFTGASHSLWTLLF